MKPDIAGAGVKPDIAGAGVKPDIGNVVNKLQTNDTETTDRLAKFIMPDLKCYVQLSTY